MPIAYSKDPAYWQRFLTCLGYYHGAITSNWDANSQIAAKAFEATGEAIAKQLGTFDARSELHIRSLHPTAQGKARTFLAALNAAQPFTDGWFATIGSGTRTYKEQDIIFQKGRDASGKKIGTTYTNARGGYSNHNFGLAWDLSLFKADGTSLDALEETKMVSEAYSSGEYRRAAPLGKKQGLVWGGDWKKFEDVAHYQIFPDTQLAAVRGKFEAGKPIP